MPNDAHLADNRSWQVETYRQFTVTKIIRMLYFHHVMFMSVRLTMTLVAQIVIGADPTFPSNTYYVTLLFRQINSAKAFILQ